MTARTRAVVPVVFAVALLGCSAGTGGSGEGDAVGPGGKADFGYEPDPGFDYDQCPEGAPKLVDRPFDNGQGPAAWTVIHYAAADNNLEGALLEDIHEMERGHDGTSNVNVLVQLDMRSEDGMWRYEVKPSDQDVEDPERADLVSRQVLHRSEEPDSADPDMLVEYARWAIRCYPAERYAFIIGGHGGGWSVSEDDDADDDRAYRELTLRAQQRRRFATRRIRRDDEPRGELPPQRTPRGEAARFIAPDDSSGGRIYVDELAGALERIRKLTVRCGETPEGRQCENGQTHNRLAFYGSDACLMGDTGVLHALRNGPMYVIGSEENEPGAGWPYNTAIRTLSERPYYYAQRPHRLVDAVVDAYGRSYGPGGSESQHDRITLAAVDTAALERAEHRLATVGELLQELVYDDGVAEHAWGARDAAYDFGDGYVDLGLFARELRESMVEDGLMPATGAHWNGDERYRTLRDAMDSLLEEVWPGWVVASVSGADYEGATGVSVFLPERLDGWGVDLESFARSGFAERTGWHRFVEELHGRGGHGQAHDGRLGYGEMTFDVTVGGDTLIAQSPASYVECALSHDDLEVYIEGFDGCVETGEECVYPPDLSFEIDTREQVVESYLLWSHHSEFDLDAEESYTSVSIDTGSWQPDEGGFSGRFTIETPRYGDEGEIVRSSVEFTCGHFQ